MLWKCCKNIIDVALFLKNSSHVISATTIFFSSHFWQWHCHNCQFFFSYFGNVIATFGFPCVHSHFEHPLGQQVWAEGISVMVLLKIKNFSLPLFLFLSPTFVELRQWYCRNSLSFFRFLNKLEQINFEFSNIQPKNSVYFIFKSILWFFFLTNIS